MEQQGSDSFILINRLRNLILQIETNLDNGPGPYSKGEHDALVALRMEAFKDIVAMQISEFDHD